MHVYLEKRIEFQRVFMQIEMGSTVIKYTTRPTVSEQWGTLRYEEFRDDEHRVQDGNVHKHTFRIEKAALAYIEAVKKALLDDGFHIYDGTDDPRLKLEHDLLFEKALKEAIDLKKSGEAICENPVDPIEWKLLEDEYEIILPASYKKFISNMNGLKFNTGNSLGSFFYTLSEVRARYKFMLEVNDGIYADSNYLPIGESHNGEAILIASSNKNRAETPVVHAFNGQKPAKWDVFFTNFAECFICYVGQRNVYTPFTTIYANGWKPPEIEAEGKLK